MYGLQITEKGMSFLNNSGKRKVLIEKFKNLGEVDIVFAEVDSQMLFILDKMQDGEKRLPNAFKEEEKKWKIPVGDGDSIMIILLGYGFLREVAYP